MRPSTAGVRIVVDVDNGFPSELPLEAWSQALASRLGRADTVASAALVAVGGGDSTGDKLYRASYWRPGPSEAGYFCGLVDGECFATGSCSMALTGPYQANPLAASFAVYKTPNAVNLFEK